MPGWDSYTINTLFRIPTQEQISMDIFYPVSFFHIENNILYEHISCFELTHEIQRYTLAILYLRDNMVLVLLVANSSHLVILACYSLFIIFFLFHFLNNSLIS